MQTKTHALKKIYRAKNKNRGENNSRSKLTRQDVVEIFNSKKTQKELAKTYMVTQGTISQIKNKKIWQWIWNK